MSDEKYSPALRQFVDRLLIEKKLDNLEPEILQQAKADLLQKADQAVKVAIFDNIPSVRLTEFNQLMEAGDDTALQKFIQSVVPNLEQVIAQSLLNFRDTYLG